MSHPAATPVQAFNVATGEIHTYASMRQAATLGGFDYTSVKNCVQGKTPIHAGFRFKAVGEVRKTKANNLISRVAGLRRKGLTNRQIAEQLGITKNTACVYACKANNMGLCLTYWETCEKLGIDPVRD